MRNKLTAIFLVTVGLLVVSIPLSAHHGNAAYATGKVITVKGLVTDWIWANPHCWLKVDTKDEGGEVTHWIIEAGNPPDMTRQGWAKTSLKPGDSVTVTLIQAKNGTPVGRVRSVALSNGQMLSSGANPTP